MMPRRLTQRGVALVTALVVVAIATTTAALLASHQQLTLRRTANVVDGDQARLYTLGAEAWARRILARDARDNDSDGPGDSWATQLPPMPVPGGQVSGRVTDLQGRFNINSVLTGDALDPVALERLRRLLQHLDIAGSVGQAIADWLDPDLEPQGSGGAEDGYYTALETPYRSGNVMMASTSELRLIRGIDAEAYERLAPHVAALPQRTPINVNTATEAVLVAIGLDTATAEAITELRQEEAFDSVTAFTDHPLLEGSEVDSTDLSVSSQFFLLTAEATVSHGQRRLFTVLQRGNRAVQPLRRSFGTR